MTKLPFQVSFQASSLIKNTRRTWICSWYMYSGVLVEESKKQINRTLQKPLPQSFLAELLITLVSDGHFDPPVVEIHSAYLGGAFSPPLKFWRIMSPPPPSFFFPTPKVHPLLLPLAKVLYYCTDHYPFISMRR